MTAQAMRRFRDYGLLRFAVRSVELYAPWLRRIIFVTNGQVPTWLNTSRTLRAVVVTHSQIFSQAAQNDGALPTFNSNAIEANLWRVPGLAECFVYLNDDMFFARPTPLSKLIDRRTGKLLLDMDGFQAPELEAAKHNIWHRSVVHSNNLLNSHFHPGRSSVTKHNYAGHCGYIMRSSVLKKMAQWWPDDFEATSRRKWRHGDDTALPFLHHNTALESGIAEKQPGGLGRQRWYAGGSWTENSTNNGATWRRIERSEAHCVCLQDGFGDSPHVNEEIRRLEGLLCGMFPHRSSLEKKTDPNPCLRWGLVPSKRQKKKKPPQKH